MIGQVNCPHCGSEETEQFSLRGQDAGDCYISWSRMVCIACDKEFAANITFEYYCNELKEPDMHESYFEAHVNPNDNPGDLPF